jgi:hypothetical protein
MNGERWAVSVELIYLEHESHESYGYYIED